MITGTGEIDHARGYRLFVLRFAHRAPEPAAEHFGQLAVAVIGQVQHAHQGDLKIHRQVMEQLQQGADTTGRSAQRNRLNAFHDLR
ncbi:hypothetical protein D3C72_1902410 [compost metagenome]